MKRHPSYRTRGTQSIRADDDKPHRRIIALILLRAVWDSKLTYSQHNPEEEISDAREFLHSDYAAHLAELIDFDLQNALRRIGNDTQ